MLLDLFGITSFKLARATVRSGAWLAKKGITRLRAAIGTAKRANENKKEKEAIRNVAILKDVSSKLISKLEADLPNKQEATDKLILEFENDLQNNKNISEDEKNKIISELEEDKKQIEAIRNGNLSEIESFSEKLNTRSEDELSEMKKTFVDSKAQVIFENLKAKKVQCNLEDVKKALDSVYVEQIQSADEKSENKNVYKVAEDSPVSIEMLKGAGFSEKFYEEYLKLSNMSVKDAEKLYKRINVQPSGKLEVKETNDNSLEVDKDLIKCVAGLRFSAKDYSKVKAANDKIAHLNKVHEKTEVMRAETGAIIDMMLARNLQTYVKDLEHYIEAYENQRLNGIPTQINKQELKNLKRLRTIAAQKVQMLEKKRIIEVTNNGKDKTAKVTDKAKEILLKDNLQEFEEHGKKEMRNAETYRRNHEDRNS